MSAAAGDALSRFGERLSERLNPIVVKEVRQGLRTRVFWVFFTLMLVACLCISLAAWATADRTRNAGQTFFIAYFVCLAGVQFFVIPYTAYRSMAREREDETWVLLTLTGLGPRRILRGKLSSFLVQGALYASAAGPFLVFSYFLNGIDLPTIALAVLLSVPYQLFLTSVGVSVATLADSRVVRALLHFVLLGLLVWALGMGVGSVVGLSEAGRKLYADDMFTPVLVGALFLMTSTAWLLFEAAAARLSLPTESYAKGPRLVFLLQAFGLVLLSMWVWHQSGRDKDVLAVSQVLACLYLTVVGLFVMSDHDGMSRRHWLGGGRLSLFKPGALRGYLLVLLCLLLATSLYAGLYAVEESHFRLDTRLRVMVGAPAMVALYLSAPMAIARWLPHHPSQTPLLVRVCFCALVLVGTALPPLVAVLVGLDGDARELNMLNPFIGLFNLERSSGRHALSLMAPFAAATLAVFVALSVLWQRDAKP